MKEDLEREISTIVDGKLSSDQIKDLSGFFKQVLSNNMEQDEESFFKDLTYDLTGDLKDLALLIIDFKKDIQSKISPDITDLATKYIPQATDQLEGVIETTETATHKIIPTRI